MSRIDDEATILLVEDSVDDTDLILHAFRKANVGNPIKVVSDGDQAVNYLQGTAGYADRQLFPIPGLILLDLKLPRLSGFEVLASIRAMETVRGIPVIVLTSSDQDKDIRKAYDAGANAYLVKPVGRDALVALVQSLDAFWIKLNWSPS